MRYLAIDLGDKRTGLAVGDEQTRLATPVDMIEAPLFAAAAPTARDRAFGSRLLDEIDRAVHEHLDPADALVLGLPLNMDGSEGPRAALVRRFAEAVAARTGRTVLLVDERRSSMAADERLARTGLTHGQKKRRRDAIAAAEILQRLLDTKPDHAETDSPEPDWE